MFFFINAKKQTRVIPLNSLSSLKRGTGSRCGEEYLLWGGMQPSVAGIPRPNCVCIYFEKLKGRKVQS